jgi:CheY-like chemotaxis protein
MTKSKEILFIDDENMTLKVGSMLLRAMGYKVTPVLSGYDGLKLLKAHKFDIVLLDLMMPEIYGLDVLRQIRENKDLDGLPVIIQTGVMNPEELNEARALGATNIITKPYDRDVLKEVLSKALSS